MRNETKNIKITNPLEDYRIVQISRKTGKISGNINPALTALQSEFMPVIGGPQAFSEWRTAGGGVVGGNVGPPSFTGPKMPEWNDVAKWQSRNLQALALSWRC